MIISSGPPSLLSSFSVHCGIQDDKDMWRKKKRKRNRTIDYSDLPSTLVYECSVSNLTIKISTFSNVAGERLPWEEVRRRRGGGEGGGEGERPRGGRQGWTRTDTGEVGMWSSFTDLHHFSHRVRELSVGANVICYFCNSWTFWDVLLKLLLYITQAPQHWVKAGWPEAHGDLNSGAGADSHQVKPSYLI